jgi:hypothetical protein
MQMGDEDAIQAADGLPIPSELELRALATIHQEEPVIVMDDLCRKVSAMGRHGCAGPQYTDLKHVTRVGKGD